MSVFTNEKVIKDLREGKIVVEFKKLNGDLRQMYCTLNEEFIPEDRIPKTSKQPTPDVVRAFDMFKGEWRSFRTDNILTINKQPSENTLASLEKLAKI